MTTQALEKIGQEIKDFKGDKYAMVMKDRCSEALKNFCQQDEEFAQAVVQTDKTFSDCMAEVVKKVKGNNGISDLDAFKEIVSFYFPGAGINFSMTIDLCASVKKNITVSQSTAPEKKTALNISLDDLFDM